MDDNPGVVKRGMRRVGRPTGDRFVIGRQRRTNISCGLTVRYITIYRDGM